MGLGEKGGRKGGRKEQTGHDNRGDKSRVSQDDTLHVEQSILYISSLQPATSGPDGIRMQPARPCRVVLPPPFDPPSPSLPPTASVLAPTDPVVAPRYPWACSPKTAS